MSQLFGDWFWLLFDVRISLLFDGVGCSRSHLEEALGIVLEACRFRRCCGGRPAVGRPPALCWTLESGLGDLVCVSVCLRVGVCMVALFGSSLCFFLIFFIILSGFQLNLGTFLVLGRSQGLPWGALGSLFWSLDGLKASPEALWGPLGHQGAPKSG